MLERRNLQQLEVEDDFFRFVGIEHTPKPRLTTRSAAIAALNHQQDGPKFDIRCRDFVRQWIEHPEQLKPVDEAYRKHAEALMKLREVTKLGKMTAEVKERVKEILFKMSLPTKTPAGLHMGRSVVIDYIQQVTVHRIPSLAIETAISEHEWISQGGTDGNTLIDEFHMISALPYVDELISDDSSSLVSAGTKDGARKSETHRECRVSDEILRLNVRYESPT